eukprot:CAMPEP_0172359432 /NCGR_PEP_ID=MMETSP1060-20121228/3628_1 /TAXON_ID=37318 /ORGANISM="Pseudo-nitzschia pungens, Strain cf. cingulata" /LENGTH=62 /DNA_ID=CAMNT_0013081077 /DNA_START=150 /DNA_END=338 /DNA_ORIENTATION=+
MSRPPSKFRDIFFFGDFIFSSALLVRVARWFHVNKEDGKVCKQRDASICVGTVVSDVIGVHE